MKINQLMKINPSARDAEAQITNMKLKKLW